MCVYSMVIDHFNARIPEIAPVTPTTVTLDKLPTFSPLATKEDIESLRKLISEYHEAVKAALIVDKLTGQPDCVDPEKQKLEERVAKLEEELAKLKKKRIPIPGPPRKVRG